MDCDEEISDQTMKAIGWSMIAEWELESRGFPAYLHKGSLDAS